VTGPGGEGRAESRTVEGRARPLAAYPHFRRAGGFVFVSGTSARRPDGSVAGVEVSPDGAVRFDALAQSRAVLANIEAILAAAGAGLSDLVEVTVFLTDMADYAAMNQAWNERFDPGAAPARTTVGVKALPGPHLVVEMRAVALAPVRPGA
jgi:2-aminomuconate deaminase